MAWRLPRHEVTVIGNDLVTESIRRVRLRFPEPVGFRPGDYLVAMFEGRIHRNYSIANVQSPSETIDLLVSVAGDGVGVRSVAALRSGDRLRVDGPTGDFHLHDSPNGESWFLATSTGVAPFLPMLADAAASGERTVTYVGARTPARLPRFRGLPGTVRYAVTAPDAGWRGLTGRINEVAAADLLRRDPAVPRNYYVCGLRSMVKSTVRALRGLGVPEAWIFTEAYQ